MKHFPRFFFSLVLFALLIESIPFQSHAQWIDARGPAIESVHAIAVSDSVLIIGTERSGLFRSVNGGESWTASNTGLTDPWTIVLAATGTSLIAGTYGAGIFRSVDHGLTWAAVSIELRYSKTVLAFTRNGADLYAGTFLNGIYRSTDDGATWSQTSQGLKDSVVNALYAAGGAVFAGTNNGIYRSTNNGTNWIQIGDEPTNTKILSLAFVDSVFIAGTPTGILRSGDFGAHWSAVNTGRPSYYNVSGLAVFGSLIYASSQTNGILRSNDRGLTWSDGNSGIRDNTIWTVNASGGDLYTGTNRSIFRLTDGDTSWTDINSRLTSGGLYSMAASGSKIFVGGDGEGIYRSNDNGANWKPVYEGIGKRTIWSLYRHGSALFAATLGKVFRSHDDGAHWSEANEGLPVDNFVTQFNSIGVDLFAVASDGLYRSVNNGDTWMRLKNGVATIAASETNLIAVMSGTIIVSADHGTSWIYAKTESPKESVKQIAASSASLFAMTTSGAILRSTDHGLVWRKTGETALSGNLLAADSTLFLAVARAGVYRSTDLGRSWSLIDAGMNDKRIEMSGVSESDIFAGIESDGKYGNLYRRPIAEVSNPVVSVRAPETPVVTENERGILISIPANADTAVKGYKLYRKYVSSSTYGWSVNIGNNRSYQLENGSIGEHIAVSAYGLSLTGKNDQDKGYESGFVAAVKHYRPTATVQSISVGDVALGDSTTRSFFLKNPSVIPTAITSIGTKTGLFRLSSGALAELPPNDSVAISVTFTPQAYGAYWDTLTIATDAGRLLITLDGQSMEPVFWLPDPAPNWGSQKKGQSIVKPLKITTLFHNPLVIDSVMIKSRVFTVNAAIFPLIIGIGDTALVPIKFSPDSVKTYADTIFFYRHLQKPSFALLRGIGLAASGTDGIAGENAIPDRFELGQNFPNPFNPTTTITFSIPIRTHVSLKIFDALGREQSTLVSEELMPGVYSRQWDAADHPSGIYFYRLETGAYSSVRKLVLIR